jgi:hypothetical protein
MSVLMSIFCIIKDIVKSVVNSVFFAIKILVKSVVNVYSTYVSNFDYQKYSKKECSGYPHFCLPRCDKSVVRMYTFWCENVLQRFKTFFTIQIKGLAIV